MKKIVFIIPYFGKFNNYFQLFLNSCAKNPSIDWLIFTDDKTDYNYSSNVKVKYTTFEVLKREFQKKFTFPIALNRPYKLCDFKPAYGYLFEDYIKDYDFWGFCDTDVIFGNIRNFITDRKLENYDKIGFFGHFTLFKNEEKINKAFMIPINNVEVYKNVYSSNDNSSSKQEAFDEEYKNSINVIFKNNNFSCDFNEYQANIYTKSSNFKLTKYNFDTNKYEIEKLKRAFFVYDNGSLKRFIKIKNEIVEEEFLYIHMQSRNMSINIDVNSNIYKIIPNKFDNIEEYPITKHNFKNIKKKYKNLHYFKLRTKNLILKIKKRLSK